MRIDRADYGASWTLSFPDLKKLCYAYIFLECMCPEQILNIIQYTNDRIKLDNNFKWIWNSNFEKEKIETAEEFAVKIYEISVVFSKMVWLDLKPYFVGSENVIQIVCPKTKER